MAMQAQLTHPKPPPIEGNHPSPRESDTNKHEIASRKFRVAGFGYLSTSLLMVAAVHWCDTAYKQQPWYGLVVSLICFVAAMSYIGITIFIMNLRKVHGANGKGLE